MSNPFWGIQPVSVPFSGNVKSDGTFSFTTEMRAAFWTSTKLVAEVSGGANWKVATGGIPLDYASGPRCSLGPFLLAPSAFATVTLVNALPGTAVTGQFVGVQGPDLASLIGAFNQSSNPQAAVLSSQVEQGNVQGSPGGTNVNFTLPPLATALLIIATAVDANSHVKVVGITSTKTYQDVDLKTVGQQVFATGFDPTDYSDPGITVTVSNAVSTNTVVYFVSNGTVFPTNSRSLPLWVVTSGFNVGITGQPITVQEGTAPPLWQAPRVTPAAVEVSAVATATLVAGVLNQVIRVFGWELQIDNGGLAVAGQFTAYLEGDTSLKRVGTISATGVDKSVTGYHAGAPLNSGEGLRLNGVAVGTGTVRALASVSQG